MSLEVPNFKSNSPASEKSEPIKSEQAIAWEKMRLEVDKITDDLGYAVDEKIRETVTAFKIHGFATSQSCEGHIEKKLKNEAPFPWVEIEVGEPKDWKEADNAKKIELEEEWITKNLEQQRKMMEFLSEFYQKRNVSFDTRLTFDRSGAFGGFRVQSFGGEIMKILPPNERLKKLEIYQKEMNDFTLFLKEKFFLRK